MREPLLPDDNYPDYVTQLPFNARCFIFDASKADPVTRESIRRVMKDFNIDGGTTNSGIFMLDNDSHVRNKLDEIFFEDFLVTLQDNGVKINI